MAESKNLEQNVEHQEPKRNPHLYDYMFKIIIVGESAVGKSNMLLRYTKKAFQQRLEMTVGVEFDIKFVNRNEKIFKLQIWDTAGQEVFRSITQSYYKHAVGCILMYDITCRESFNNMDRWFDDIKKRCDISTIIVLVGNKTDLENRREVSFDEGKELAEKYNVEFFETSVLKSQQINDCFNHIIDTAYKNIASDPEFNEVTNDANVIDINKNDVSKSYWSGWYRC